MDFGVYQPDGIVEGIDHSGEVAPQVTAGSANVKGSYVELTSSLPQDITGFSIFIMASTAGVEGAFLLDVAVGAAASEEVIVSNLQFGSLENSDNFAVNIFMPIRIANGERVSTRCQSSNAGGVALRVSIVYHTNNYGMYSQSYSRALGAVNLSTSEPFGKLDPGGAANTKGVWTDISGALSRDYNAVMFYSSSTNDDITRASCTWLIDVAISADSIFGTIVENMYSGGHANHDGFGSYSPLLIPISLASGTSLYGRAQCSITDADSRIVTVSQMFLV